MSSLRAWGRCLAGAVIALLAGAGMAQAVTIKTVTSPGGITAWLVEDHSQPVISLDFSVAGGAAADPVDKSGLSTLVGGLLDEGAGTLDSGAFQGRLADLSASIGFSAERDHFRGHLTTLAPHRDEVFELLHQALVAPRFDAPAVARVRGEIGQMIEEQTQDPDSIAALAWSQLAYPNHPYDRSSLGTQTSLAAITEEDLRAYVPARLGRDRLMVAVVGDVSAEALAPLLDQVFGGLPARTVDPVTPADTAPKGAGEIAVLPMSVPQTVIQFGEPGLKITDPDYFAYRVALQILGGSTFTARLPVEVREKRGLAYYVYAAGENFDHADAIIGRTATQNAKAAETIQIIRTEWARFHDQGATAAEVQDAKTYLNGSYPLGLDSTGAIANRLIGMEEEHLGTDWFERRPKMIGAVTVEDVKRVAKRILDPAALAFVAVGKPQDVTGNVTVTVEP